MKISVSRKGSRQIRYCPHCGETKIEISHRYYACMKCGKRFKGIKIRLGPLVVRVSLKNGSLK